MIELMLKSMLIVCEAELMMLNDYMTLPEMSPQVKKESDACLAKARDFSEEIVKLASARDEIKIWCKGQYLHSKTLFLAKEDQKAKEVASKARFLCQRAQDQATEANVCLVLGQVEHRLDPGAMWATNVLNDALDLFKHLRDSQMATQTMALFEALGIAVRLDDDEGGDGDGPAVPLTRRPIAATGAASSAAESAVAEVPKGMDPEMVERTVWEVAKGAIGNDE